MEKPEFTPLAVEQVQQQAQVALNELHTLLGMTQQRCVALAQQVSQLKGDIAERDEQIKALQIPTKES